MPLRQTGMYQRFIFDTCLSALRVGDIPRAKLDGGGVGVRVGG